MTPLERAARALYRLHDAPSPELLDRLKASGDEDALAEEMAEEDHVWPRYVADVRAVLEAIREPNDEMVAAGAAKVCSEWEAGSVWEQMIDAALSK